MPRMPRNELSSAGRSRYGRVLVAADVERAHDQRQPVERPHHLGQRLVLLVLGRRLVAAEEQELGAHQADALGPGLDGRRRLARRG